MFPADVFNMQHPCPDYVKGTLSTIMKIHEKEKPGDILAFLTGQEEVMDVVDLLREHIQDRPKDDLQGTRKAIIATNIAETSITIPGVVYVIDSGFTKLKWFDAESNTDSLIVVPISKAAAEQRAGRAGRRF